MVARASLLLALAGAALALGLIAAQGFAPIAALLRQGGLGLVLAALVHIVPMALNAQGWRLLIPGRGRPSLLAMTLIVWAREAVNGLLPVARIGGEVASLRLLVLFGQRQSIGIASLIVDLTIGVGCQFALTLVIVAILLVQGIGADIGWIWLAGLGLALALMIGAYRLQKTGALAPIARLIEPLARDRLPGLLGASTRIDRAVRLMYRRSGQILISLAFQLLGWLAGSLEIWLALISLGQPLSLGDAVALEALIQALSSAAFIVPGALGVQEGGFLMFGGGFGLTGEVALALALARRLRDLIVFGPGLMILPWVEARGLVGAKASTRSAAPGSQ